MRPRPRRGTAAVARTARRSAAVAVLAATLTAVTPAAVAAALPSGSAALVVQTSPALPGTKLALDGQTVTAGPDGMARVVPASWVDLKASIKVLPPPSTSRRRARFARWIGLPEWPIAPTRDVKVTAAFDVDYQTRLSFVDLAGRPVDRGSISEVVMRDATGVESRFSGDRLRRPVWLWGTRVVTLQAGPSIKTIYYTVQSVRVDGANVVNQAQQRHEPAENAAFTVKLLFYSATFVARDAIFGRPVGSAVRLRYPDGQHVRYRLDSRHEAVVSKLPRGEYDASIEGPGLPVSASVSITRPQQLTLKIITWLDLLVVVAAAGAFLGGLPLIRRRLLRARRSEDRDDHHAMATTELAEEETA
ncbi:MAG TPA: hypothetical protein VEK80_11575 [Kribbellaceae bacterium]|nr:hypothetical protein [Kribbellaceae bacterium]